jgi:transcriptional regulator with XRE-family HTH domain
MSHVSAMLLKQWRLTRKMTMRECAELLKLSDARSYQRYEAGSQWPGAVMIEHIVAMTEGDVTIVDLHNQRLTYLKDRSGGGEVSAADFIAICLKTRETAQ